MKSIFENAVGTLSKERMKGRNPHVVYLSRQALDIFVALHTYAAGSNFVLPSRYDSGRCMSQATLNRITQIVAERAKAAEQRRHMLQEWANMVDAWIDGESYVPALMPENAVVPTLSATT